MTIQPIKPSQVVKSKQEALPDQVLEAFNELIVAKFDGHGSTFKSKEVVSLIASKMGLEKKDLIYSNHWLDVEDIYRKAGWIVKYDQPGWNESFDAFFEFRKKK